ncbi:hypothetical protein Salmuc_01715 [Salipiger mucosus DSM 16094]|uniref:Uncharacterized protein n=1 Tax=Salipiger mucosus DSM 16094 TaxID=1123237 RepID=S9S141_9RHOB|nr:hypothetical protein Salmuc_01715 [Salipiger mucosus DSM 16094]
MAELGADHCESGHRSKAEKLLGQAEDTLKKAHHCTRVATPDTVKMFRRHAIAVVAKVREADQFMDAFEEEISPPSTGMTP